MSGRQAKVLNEQATRYGIPFSGRTIDLPAVVKALHDFLAQGRRINETQTAEQQLLEMDRKYREEKYRLAKLDREAKEGELIPREMVHSRFGHVAQILRRAGEALQQNFGPEAHAILEEALDECIREVTALAGDDTDLSHD